MTDTHATQTLHEQGESFLAQVGEMAARNALLEAENKTMAQQVETLLTEIDRLRTRVEQLTGRLEIVLHDSNADKKLLEDLSNKLLAGLKSRRFGTELRGVPQRSNDTTDSLPRVVQMGPKTA
jgi:predicted nuclease with TOPRIM domain